MKKIFTLALLLVAGLSFVGCESTTQPTAELFSYSDFSEDHITVVDEQLLMPEIIYYVYYYGISCTRCQEIKQSVLTIADRLDDDSLYFVSVSGLSDIADGAGVTKIPTLLKIVNGAVTGHYEGESQIMPVLEGLQ